MKLLAYKRIAVYDRSGMPDIKSHIDAGDLCTIGGKMVGGLYPVTYPTPYGAKTRWLKSLSGFLVNQNDYPNQPYPAKGYEAATIKTSGCGVCSVIMAIGALTGINIPVKVMSDMSRSCGARVSGGTNMKTLLSFTSKRYGFAYTTTDSVSELYNHLQRGGVAICNTAGRGMFSTGGHFMTVLGILDGKLCIGDSGLYATKYKTVYRKNKVTVNGDLIFASPQTLDIDCIGRCPRYYLLHKT